MNVKRLYMLRIKTHNFFKFTNNSLLFRSFVYEIHVKIKVNK